MLDIKPIIAKNIAELRLKNGLTQLDLAEKLNYSDKAVSKWERGESLPDITVLMQIAGLFDVTLDWLVKEDHTEEAEITAAPREHHHHRGFITGICLMLVWVIALFVFILLMLIPDVSAHAWLTFVYAVPVTAIVWLTLNSIWFNPRHNYAIISLLMWSVLVTIQLSFLPAGIDLSLIYLLGIPGQIIILMWSKIKISSKN